MELADVRRAAGAGDPAAAAGDRRRHAQHHPARPRQPAAQRAGHLTAALRRDRVGRRGQVAHAAVPRRPTARRLGAAGGCSPPTTSTSAWAPRPAGSAWPARHRAAGQPGGGAAGPHPHRPLADTEATAHRIAQGDLSARIDGPGTATTSSAGWSARSTPWPCRWSTRAMLERDFLLSVSHDLRTPLTSIAGWGEALADGTAPDPAKAGATIVAVGPARPPGPRPARPGPAAGPVVHPRPGRSTSVTWPPGRPTGSAPTSRTGPAGAGGRARRARRRRRRPGPSRPDHRQPGGQRGALRRHPGGGRGRPRSGAGGRRRCWRSRTTARASPPASGPGVRAPARRRAARRPGGAGTGLGLTIVLGLARAMGGDAIAEEAGSGGARLVVSLPLRS